MSRRKAIYPENFLFPDKVRLWRSKKIGRYKNEQIVMLLKKVNGNHKQGSIYASF